MLSKISTRIDWVLFLSLLPILFVGWLTMNSFVSDNYFADRQLIWVIISILVFFAASFVDWRFLRRTPVLLILYGGVLALLAILFATSSIKGAQSWLNFGAFSFQPADLAKLILIFVLAKYFSRRHVEIANYKHILISGFYTFLPFALIALQPDFGSAIIVFFIWLGMIIVSGVSKKHLALVFLVGVLSFVFLWAFVFAPYQKARILSFVDPLSDAQGAGYNALQSVVAVGSGQIWGKGVGYGTQSRLEFLPEYETDFIFAAFAEEWGFIGILLFFLFFGVVIWRILVNASVGATNFEIFYGTGLAVMFMGHFIVHVGMNIGIMPVTGIPFPFMSYGGSHLLVEFLGLGILMGMRRYARVAHKDDINKDLTEVI